MIRIWRIIADLLRVYPWNNNSPWTDEDTMRLKQVFLSEMGVRLRARLRNTSIMVNANAVQNGSEKACGQAVGYMQCLADLQSLSGVGVPDNSESESSETGDLAEFEHISP
jgi:hypothetical protein